MVTVALTTNTIGNVWRYGNPRGGTGAVIVETPLSGKKFLTFFHSSKERGVRLKTYYWGAYLFDTDPPFAITHFSSEPISIRQLYDPAVSWVHRSLDYSVFPMRFIVRRGSI